MQNNEECYLKYCCYQLLTKVPITPNPGFRIDAIMKVLSFQVESMCVCVRSIGIHTVTASLTFNPVSQFDRERERERRPYPSCGVSHGTPDLCTIHVLLVSYLITPTPIAQNMNDVTVLIGDGSKPVLCILLLLTRDLRNSGESSSFKMSK